MPLRPLCSFASPRKTVRQFPVLLLATWFISSACAQNATHTAAAAHLLPPTALRCAGNSEPLAVVDAQPVFSWQLTAASPQLHGVAQTAYRIQAADADRGFAPGQEALWDSGVVQSPTTSGVTYAGPALKAQHAYAWRVRVWDDQGRPSGWSSIAHWTQAPVWRAEWIAADASESSELLPLFRKSFRLAKPVTRALLYASGLGQDELRINGRKVGADELTPGWSEYHKTVYYDSYDVSSLLRNGENAIGVLLGNGMYRVLKTPGRYTKFVGSYGPPKCIVQLYIEFAGGESIEIRSDGTWKTSPGPITFSSTYGGEDFDARREPQGWDRPGFDDGAWRTAAVVAGPGGTLLPELAPPIRVMHTYLPAKVTHPKPGVVVYDLAQNFAGWPEISVSGPAGAVVKLTPGELLEKDGTVSQRSSGRPQWFAYTLRGAGVENWHPRFSYYGFRYLQVEGATAGPESGKDKASIDKARILSVRGQAVHTSSQSAGDFLSSDQLLTRIHTLIVRSIENNAVSLFTDCPHREKLGWLEETHLMAPSLLYDFDFAGLFAATARNIADTQKTEGPEAGLVPEIAPQYVVFKVDNGVFDDSPEWGSTAVLAPWYVFERTGDRSFMAAQYDVMRRYVAYLSTRAHDGIIAYGLGDWFDIGPGNPGFSKLTTAGVTATAIYYQDLTVLQNVAALLGKSDESSSYRQQAEAERNAFNARFFDAAHHRYDKGSQTAQAMPLALGMVPEDESKAVLDTLVEDIRAHQNHVTAGDIGYHYVVDALLAGGRSDVLFDMLERTDTPSYGYQLAQGATALTEAWDANSASSQDHFMLGHAEEWFYRGLGGINVDLSRQGAKRLVLRPAIPGRIQWVHTHYRSALGLIESNWQRAGNETTYTFVIPANATATIELTTSSAQTVTVNGAQPSKAPGAISAHVDGNQVQIVVGSGRYEVRAANPVQHR
ncbi:MAG TPA: family 78 glycoside hydrolase catalytic domain [Terracidiphilus sp.]|nr:family 78 glycoside hydrolase catalytic domain [Terracidiphilus sp.]